MCTWFHGGFTITARLPAFFFLFFFSLPRDHPTSVSHDFFPLLHLWLVFLTASIHPWLLFFFPSLFVSRSVRTVTISMAEASEAQDRGRTQHGLLQGACLPSPCCHGRLLFPQSHQVDSLPTLLILLQTLFSFPLLPTHPLLLLHLQQRTLLQMPPPLSRGPCLLHLCCSCHCHPHHCTSPSICTPATLDAVLGQDHLLEGGEKSETGEVSEVPLVSFLFLFLFFKTGSVNGL